MIQCDNVFFIIASYHYRIDAFKNLLIPMTFDISYVVVRRC